MFEKKQAFVSGKDSQTKKKLTRAARQRRFREGWTILLVVAKIGSWQDLVSHLSFRIGRITAELDRLLKHMISDLSGCTLVENFMALFWRPNQRADCG